MQLRSRTNVFYMFGTTALRFDGRILETAREAGVWERIPWSMTIRYP